AHLVVVEPVLHGDHGELDEVGGGALHGRVDGRAFGGLSSRPAAAADFRQPQATSQNGFDIALVARKLADVFHVLRDARVAGEIAIDIQLRRVAGDAQVGGEPEGAHAVHQAEVDGLGGMTLVGADGVGGDPEDLGGGGAVDVVALRK